MTKTKCQRCGDRKYIEFPNLGLRPCPDCTPNSSEIPNSSKEKSVIPNNPRPLTKVKRGELHRKAVQKARHTCGSWPDPGWTEADFKLKAKASKACLVCNPRKMACPDDNHLNHKDCPTKRQWGLEAARAANKAQAKLVKDYEVKCKDDRYAAAGMECECCFNEAEIRKEIDADSEVVKVGEDDEVKYFVSVELAEQEGPLETEILQRKNYFYKTSKEAKARFEQMTGVLKSKPEYMKQAEDCVKVAQMNVLKEKLSKPEQTKSEDVLIDYVPALYEAMSNPWGVSGDRSWIVHEYVIRQLLLDQHRKSVEWTLNQIDCDCRWGFKDHYMKKLLKSQDHG